MNIKDFLLGYEAGAAQGGGSSADVRYVTFMSHDGAVELGKKAVAVGDDCADPIARGIFETPTKESSAQYDYSFVGWATTPNGAWDEAALDAVTEDRTVYAAYAAAVRYYTITFSDDDGAVLKTQSLAYGAMPSYTPTKTGYDFVGWTPALSAVTGSASYTAVWKKQAGFAVATWAEISAITTAGTSANTFAVGDKRREVLTYSDGKTEEIELVIAKIRTDGTMVLALNHALAKLQAMDSDKGYATAYNCALGKYLANTVLPALPKELSDVIRPVYADYDTRTLRIPSEKNITTVGDTTNGNYAYEGLPLFAAQSSRIRKQGINGAATEWYINKCDKDGSYYLYYYVKTDGTIYGGKAQGLANATRKERGVVFLIDV